MPGVQFIVDEHGCKTAVVIDRKKNANLWEDFYDRALARSHELCFAIDRSIAEGGQPVKVPLA
jgi:hypothetical protein